MGRLYVGAVLSFLIIILHDVPYSGFVVVKAINYNNPRLFKIGGVLSNNRSKAHFEKTIDVRGTLVSIITRRL
jgi:hypothetical protein